MASFLGRPSPQASLCLFFNDHDLIVPHQLARPTGANDGTVILQASQGGKWQHITAGCATVRISV